MYCHFSKKFYILKKIKSNSLLTVWCALRPNEQPTVSLNYSQSIKINVRPSDGRTIVPSTHRPTVLYRRLSDLWIWLTILLEQVHRRAEITDLTLSPFSTVGVFGKFPLLWTQWWAAHFHLLFSNSKCFVS